METQVSESLEEAVNTVEGINELRSISGPGKSLVIVTFDLDRDIDVAAQDVRDRVASVSRRLPRDIEPPIIPKHEQRAVGHVLTVALSGNRSLRELTEIADKIVKVALERVDRRRRGADRRRPRARDQHLGRGRPPRRLPAADHRGARRVERQNADVPGGNVTTDQRERSLRTMGRFADARVQRPGRRHRQRRSPSACATSAGPRTAPRSSARWRG